MLHPLDHGVDEYQGAVGLLAVGLALAVIVLAVLGYFVWRRWEARHLERT